MSEIRDVIGQIRADYLALRKDIDGLRLAVHLLEYQLGKLENPRGATQSTLEDPDGNTIDSLAPSPPSGPTASPSVGKVSKGRKRNSG